MTDLNDDSRAIYEQLVTGPSVALRMITWCLESLVGLVFAVTIMLQWVVWLAVTQQLFSGWGMLFGGLIIAVQIWLMFGTAATKSVCEIPQRSED